MFSKRFMHLCTALYIQENNIYLYIIYFVFILTTWIIDDIITFFFILFYFNFLIFDNNI